jgi:hypothetical protein
LTAPPRAVQRLFAIRKLLSKLFAELFA